MRECDGGSEKFGSDQQCPADCGTSHHPLRFSRPTIAVNSKNCASSRWPRSFFTSSSSTVGGASVIASAYSMTSRSSGLNRLLSRQWGIASIFSRGYAVRIHNPVTEVHAPGAANLDSSRLVGEVPDFPVQLVTPSGALL